MYWTVFLSLLLGAMGFPIPEELPLIAGGLTVASSDLSGKLMFLICFSGVIIGDQFMYFVGRSLGNKIIAAGQRSAFLPAVTEERVNELREGLRKRHLLYIFIGRHLFFLRSVTFLAAGSLHIPFLEFFFADFLAAIFSVSLFFGIGYMLGGHVSPEFIPHIIFWARIALLCVVALGLTVFGMVSLWRYFRKRRSAPV